MGDGSEFGSVDVSSDFNPVNGFTAGRLVGVPLNATALAAMTSAQGTHLLLGGTVTTLGGHASEREALFDGSDASETLRPNLF